MYMMVPKKLIITFTTVFTVLAAMNLITVQWIVYGDNQDKQRWCNTIVLLNDTYQAESPQTETGQKIAQELTKLERDFECR